MPSKQSKSWLRKILPSTSVSLSVHVIILVIAGMSLRSCDSGPPVEAGGRDFREIGLAIIPDRSQAVSDVASQNPVDSDVESPNVTEANPDVAQAVTVPTEAPSVSELLADSSAAPTEQSDPIENPIVGPGALQSALPTPGSLANLMTPPGRSGLGSAGSPNPAPGETTFMNIAGDGDSFVYLIDISDSMGQASRLPLAKSQLLASIRKLKPIHTFQVIFYNMASIPMKFRGRAEQQMYPATDLNSRLAKAEIERVQSSSGTRHLPAILNALRLQADVIYFLTDGDVPSLSPADLRDVRAANRQGTQIHVIEFATGPQESRGPTWLQVLARESRGNYKRVIVD